MVPSPEHAEHELHEELGGLQKFDSIVPQATDASKGHSRGYVRNRSFFGPPTDGLDHNFANC